MPSLTVAMESTVALHLFVRFSMKSITENTSQHTQFTSALALLHRPESPANEPPFLLGKGSEGGVFVCFC